MLCGIQQNSSAMHIVNVQYIFFLHEYSFSIILAFLL